MNAKSTSLYQQLVERKLVMCASFLKSTRMTSQPRPSLSNKISRGGKTSQTFADIVCVDRNGLLPENTEVLLFLRKNLPIVDYKY